MTSSSSTAIVCANGIVAKVCIVSVASSLIALLAHARFGMAIVAQPCDASALVLNVEPWFSELPSGFLT